MEDEEAEEAEEGWRSLRKKRDGGGDRKARTKPQLASITLFSF